MPCHTPLSGPSCPDGGDVLRWTGKLCAVLNPYAAVVKMPLFSRGGIIAEQHEFSDLNIMLVVPDGMDPEPGHNPARPG